jgi:hypothetical protein
LIPELGRQYVDPDREYYVDYLTIDQLEEFEKYDTDNNSNVENFFSQNKFMYAEKDNVANEKNKLSYCNSCNILRPPRAFHCPYCDFCVEVHDHHCPWVGTCIGPRNIHYFIAFLLSTSTLALMTGALNGYDFFIQEDKKNIPEWLDTIQTISGWVLTFIGVWSLSLFYFACHHIFTLICKNQTTNEYLRKRWNGDTKNRVDINKYRKRVSCC